MSDRSSTQLGHHQEVHPRSFHGRTSRIQTEDRLKNFISTAACLVQNPGGQRAKEQESESTRSRLTPVSRPPTRLSQQPGNPHHPRSKMYPQQRCPTNLTCPSHLGLASLPFILQFRNARCRLPINLPPILPTACPRLNWQLDVGSRNSPSSPHAQKMMVISHSCTGASNSRAMRLLRNTLGGKLQMMATLLCFTRLSLRCAC